jgi:hypothetical protein
MDAKLQASQPELRSKKHGVLRVMTLAFAVEIAIIALLWAGHAHFGVVDIFVFVLLAGALLSKLLIGPVTYVQIDSPAQDQRIQLRFRSESTQLSNLGFTPLFSYGEGFSILRLLWIFPAFLLVVMWLNREVVILQGSRVLFGFPVFISGDGTTFAQPLQLGAKFFTLFQDGTILMTKSFGGKKSYGERVIAERMKNATITDTWAEHQRRIMEQESAGRQIDPQISFDTFSAVSREA